MIGIKVQEQKVQKWKSQKKRSIDDAERSIVIFWKRNLLMVS